MSQPLCKFVRLSKGKRDAYEPAYPGIGDKVRLRVVNRIDVPPGDYIAPLIGVAWNGRRVAWLYERDTVGAHE